MSDCKVNRFWYCLHKTGTEKFVEYHILSEILEHKLKDKRTAQFEIIRKYPEYVGMIGYATGFSKRQLRFAVKRAKKMEMYGF